MLDKILKDDILKMLDEMNYEIVKLKKRRQTLRDILNTDRQTVSKSTRIDFIMEEEEDVSHTDKKQCIDELDI